jgi:hypothetical protein
MKYKFGALFVLAAMFLPATLFAQSPSLSCRPLEPGNTFVDPDEKVFGNQICKIVSASTPTQKSAPAQTAPTPVTPPATSGSEASPSSTSAGTNSSDAAPAKATEARPDPGPSTSQVSSGSRVVIAPMGGFETYFAAAVREKKVPITLTLERNAAQYFVVSTETEWQGFVYGSGGGASWNQGGGSAAHGSAASSTRGLEASIMLVDAKTKDIVWAYEVHKSSHGALLFGTQAARGQQSLAEACAKHLKEFIEKGK